MVVPGRPELTHIIHKLPAPSTRMTPYQRFRLVAILGIARAIPVGAICSKHLISHHLSTLATKVYE
jgi:hypothetical protein